VARAGRRVHQATQWRYPGAIGIEPEWTVEAAADPRRIVRDPDPKSRSPAIRVIGYSPGAGFVITVIATRSDHAGVTAWKTTGTDLREYEGQSRP
jgi:DsbC/DsbD-like thiol-disulfide interchange protein